MVAGDDLWQLSGLKSAGDLELERQDTGPSLRPGMQHPHTACWYWGLVGLAAGGSSLSKLCASLRQGCMCPLAASAVQGPMYDGPLQNIQCNSLQDMLSSLLAM